MRGELVIDLGNPVVAADGVRQADGHVDRAARVRREQANQFRADGVDRETLRLKVRRGVGNTLRAIAGGENRATGAGARQRNGDRDLTLEGISHGVALPFVSRKEEELVLADRAAQAAAVLLQIQRRFRVGHGVEEVAGVERGVAAKRITRPVKLVRARLERHVDNGAGRPAVLRRGILNHLELLNRVDR